MRPVARRTLSASASAVVVVGSVFGISNTAVTPPRTAAREPVSRSSLWTGPGSRKCTWLSITPGRTCSPVQSISSPAEAALKLADRGDPPVADADVAQALRRPD